MCIWRPAPARGSRQRVGRLRPGERPKRRSGGDPPDTERTPPISCGRGPGADKLATKLALVPWCSRARLWEKSMQLGGERRKKGKGRANEVFFCLVAVCQLPRHWLPVQQPHHLLRDMKTIIWISFVFFFFQRLVAFSNLIHNVVRGLYLYYISSSFRNGKPKQKSDKSTNTLEDFFFFSHLSVLKARDEGILQAGMRPTLAQAAVGSRARRVIALEIEKRRGCIRANSKSVDGFFFSSFVHTYMGISLMSSRAEIL